MISKVFTAPACNRVLIISVGTNITDAAIIASAAQRKRAALWYFLGTFLSTYRLIISKVPNLTAPLSP